MKCGFAQTIITPRPADVFQDGYGFRLHAAEGVRDELYAKVCAIEDGDFRFAIVSLDVCGLSPALDREVRGHIAAIAGLCPDRIAICATHTHAGPACGVLRDLPINGLVWAQIAVLAGRAAKEAFENAVPGRFAAAFGRDLTHLHNRRFRKPFDPRVRTAVFLDEAGTVRGILASAACHAVVNTSYLLSADFPGYLTREALRRYGVPALFLQGADGDINPYFGGEAFSEENLALLGEEFASCVLDAVPSCAPVEARPARAAVVRGTLPMRGYPDEDTLAGKLAALEARYYACPDSPTDAVPQRILLRELLWTRDALARVRAGERHPTLSVPAMAMTAGGLGFVFSPFELLTLTGQSINAQLASLGIPDAARFVATYANGTNGYLATASELPSGGYEFESAPQWYGIPFCSDKTEGAYLALTAEAAAALK